MDLYMGIYSALLFLLLSPGVLFRFPSKNPMIVLGVHAILFAIIYQLTHKAIYREIYGREGFELGPGGISAIAVGAILLITGLAFISQPNTRLD
jgi:hypothetical protein